VITIIVLVGSIFAVAVKLVEEKRKVAQGGGKDSPVTSAAVELIKGKLYQLNIPSGYLVNDYI
jgi:hypothetical protein